MAVEIKIVNKLINENNNECRAAIVLRDMLIQDFSKEINGTICIAYGLTMYGQEVRDLDILLFGQLENYYLPNYYTNNIHYPKKDLKVDNFCIAIELKEHSSDCVSASDSHIYVQYDNYWKDATEQNEKQRYSCTNYIENVVGYRVFTTNFVWLKSLSKKDLEDITNDNGIGALPATFSFKDIVNVLINQKQTPYYNKSEKCYHTAAYREEERDIVTDIEGCIFFEIKPDGLTRKRIETLLQQNEDNTIESNIDKNLIILQGQAGTGKTFRLIQTAFKLANSTTGKRCIILTYNHALVSDIRRLFHFMEIPDDIDTYTIQIQTLHSFFIQLMKICNIDTSQIREYIFDRQYEQALNGLLVNIKMQNEKKKLSALKNDNAIAIDWDYILIDEAQDWLPQEKEILFEVYGKTRILVADGVDQFMRQHTRLKWTEKENTTVVSYSTCMRQKSNLLSFVKLLASKLNVPWKVQVSNNEILVGGHVYIESKYTNKLHKELLKRSKKADCESYDMLLLVPYQMKPTYEPAVEGITKIDINAYQRCGIKLFDGTSESKRREYPTDVEQCRLFQYDSCRGLEGWVVVCMNFDVLVENKMKEFKKLQDEEESVALESPEEKLRNKVFQWILMPLTRPIDTLVITLKNPDSEIGKVLKSISEQSEDYVTWNCN